MLDQPLSHLCLLKFLKVIFSHSVMPEIYLVINRTGMNRRFAGNLASSDENGNTLTILMIMNRYIVSL